MNSQESKSLPIVSETDSGSVTLRVLVQPRASRDEVAGVHGDYLKIRLTSPPVEGAANKNLIRFLSKKLKVPASRIEITKGHRARQKVIKIENCKLEHVKSRLGL